jgi:hypothetical protein
MTLPTMMIVAALVCAICGVFNWTLGNASDGKARRTPNWIALALAFWFGSLLMR